MSSQNPPTSLSRFELLTFGVALASLVVSTISIVVSYWAFDVSKRAEGRASGKIKATFEDLTIFPTERKYVPEGIEMEFLDGIHVFSIKNLRDFIEWAPSCVMRSSMVNPPLCSRRPAATPARLPYALLHLLPHTQQLGPGR